MEWIHETHRPEKRPNFSSLGRRILCPRSFFLLRGYTSGISPKTYDRELAELLICDTVLVLHQ